MKKKSKRKIYIGSFTGNSINVHNPQREQEDRIEDLKQAERLVEQAQEQCLTASQAFISDIVELSRQVIRLAEKKATDHPGLFDGCVPREKTGQDLIVATGLNTRDVRDGTVGDMFHYLGRTLDHIVDFGKDTFTGHPYDAFCDLTDILADTTAAGVQVAFVPAQAIAGFGGLGYATYKRITDEPPSPYGYFCRCKQNVLNYINLIVTAAGEPVKAANSDAVTFVKGAVDEFLYQFDPGKVIAVTTTLQTSLIFGIEKGIVNSAVNIMDTASAAYSLLSSQCQLLEGETFIPDNVMEEARKIAQYADALYEADEMVKELAHAMAQEASGLLATEIRQMITRRLNRCQSAWKSLGWKTTQLLLPSSLSKEVSQAYIHDLDVAIGQIGGVIIDTMKYIKSSAQHLNEEVNKNWKCKRTEDKISLPNLPIFTKD